MIEYQVNGQLSTEEFITLLKASSLGSRRPVEDVECIKGMVDNADLHVSARVDGQLVGIARSVTDFTYCCYLSDLAVEVKFQRQGIGKEMIKITRQQLGPQCKIILLSAPAATQYYEPVGFHKHPQAWVSMPEGDQNAGFKL